MDAATQIGRVGMTAASDKPSLQSLEQVKTLPDPFV
jgi:hypothetical protein